MNNLNHAVILAAGKGTRMASVLPKCAVPVNGKPMIKYVVDACHDAGINDIVVVVGYKKEDIISILQDDKTIKFVTQTEQLGTAHACLMAEPALKDANGVTIILPGDMPLIGSDNIKALLDKHYDNHNDMTILSTIFDNPFSYGRIIRGADNNVIGIIEEKEATDEQKLIKEVNTGLYSVDNKLLFSSLHKVDNNNNKGEYYLTDIVKILSTNYKIDTLAHDNDYHLTGINDMDTLHHVEDIINSLK